MTCTKPVHRPTPKSTRLLSDLSGRGLTWIPPDTAASCSGCDVGAGADVDILVYACDSTRFAAARFRSVPEAALRSALQRVHKSVLTPNCISTINTI